METFTSTATAAIPMAKNRFLPQKPFRNREFRIWRRHRLKLKPKRKVLSLRNELDPSTPPPLSSSPFELLSLASFNWLPPAALGFASALAISLTNKKDKIRVSNSNSGSDSDSRVVDIGEWILFTSPTPFNRFVLLRCPSVSFEGGEFLEDVSDKLVKEEKHYVRLDSGRIQVRSSGGGRTDGEEREIELEYQRECVATEDGGVISLDWPANLDLMEEHGLDTTVILIPGTAEGSMDENVRSFVCECLKRGLFPVVMNPRGCAGSPLTNARLFTAADSDDICSAIQFITRARPWSTLTGVGWGYGANMLTKYLAEAGEKTPLTAATCINNPFDLDEVTRTTPYSSTIDGKLTGGLVDILRSNKELFQGRRKSFDVEKALSAKSVRDFERAISMVSYGFDTIEEFYSNSSTRSLVGKLKIPVLFIQNDDETVPLFSIPRALIAENPFTSLLLCSCLPSNVAAISWCQQVTVEWLTAVELGLLKGRHPLLQDIDVAINPSKGLALLEGRTSYTNDRLDSVLNLAELDSSNAYMDPMKEMLQENDTAARINGNSNQVSQGKQTPEDQVLSESNGAFLRTSSVDADSTKDNGTEPVLQTAHIVMNMLDVTMPGTLKEEDKKKVLAAIGQGDTLVKALQDAVPEDVRGKLTTSVSEILQAQGKNLNFDGLLSLNKIANVSSGLRSNIKQNMSKSSVKNENNDHPSDQEVGGNDPRQSNGNNQADVDKHAGEVTKDEGEEKSVKPSDVLESKSGDRYGDDTCLPIGPNESQNIERDSYLSAKKLGEVSEFSEEGSEITPMMSSSSQNGGGTDSGEAGIGQNRRSLDDETNQMDVRVKHQDMSARVGNHQDSPNEQSKTSSLAENRSADTSEAPAPPTSSEVQLSEKGGDDGKSKDEKLVQPLPEQNRDSDTKSPTFNVSQALDALTGLDDSTQVAVNSVFGVIEDMITKLEEKKNESTVKKGNENNDSINPSATKEASSGGELQLEKQTDGDDQESTNPEDLEIKNGNKSESSKENDPATVAIGKKINGETSLVFNKLAIQNAWKLSKTNELPFYRTENPYAEAFYHECLRKYILSNVTKAKPLELDTTTALFLDYNPGERRWLLPDQPGHNHDAKSSISIDRMKRTTPLRKENVVDNIIEPSYVILDSERQEEPAKKLQLQERQNVNLGSNLDESTFSVKTVVLNSLKVEVSRRLGVTDLKDLDEGLAADMEEVAYAVYLAIQHDKEHNRHFLYSGFDDDVLDRSRLEGKHIVEAISLVVQNTSYLKLILPVGVIVGSCLAALRNFFNVAALHDNTDARALNIGLDYSNGSKTSTRLLQEAIQLPTNRTTCDPVLEKNSEEVDETTTSNSLDGDDEEMTQSKTLNRDTLMVGAVTAALGASAILANQQEDFMGSNSSGISSSTANKLEKQAFKLEDYMNEKRSNNIVTSLAEKAMSVAAPVVPKKEDGEVDQERLVAMLAELGQKGGALKLVGKLALLWGGLRGAMSLTDRLISFLRLAERPLVQRVLGFFCMALVLWSPVLVPLLPTLFHNWATHNSSRIAELACILGLYTAVTILIVLWGKRIRGHEHPLKQYGLDLKSPGKIQDVLTGLVGGITLVLCIHAVNTLLGFVNLSLPPNLSSSSLDFAAKIKVYGKLFLLAGQGIVTAAGVAFVEELLFRSWLLEEIAVDLGYHPGILLSGLAFSLSQRSLLAIPGLWLLSISLAGARLRMQGSIFFPIGMRTGIMASTYILHMGGFLVYQPKFHRWIAGTHPLQPFNGLVGLAFALLLAIFLYPRHLGLREKLAPVGAEE